MMNDGLMHLDEERKASCNPIVVFFADGNIDDFLETVWLFGIFVEW